MKSRRQGHPPTSLKAERVQRSGSTPDRTPLKAERVQRSGTTGERTPLKAERVQRQQVWAWRLQQLPGWCLDDHQNLEKVFVATDLATATRFAEAVGALTGPSQAAVQRRGHTVRVTLPPPAEGPTSPAFARAAEVDTLWPEG
jgi:hypothetical protein